MDADYFAQKALNNCCLINLEDMLQNGTVINGVMIEKPHGILTASTIATQIILGVSSSQYGGCTVSLTHLAPFVRDSFIKYLRDGIMWVEGYEKETADEIIDWMKESNHNIKMTEAFIYRYTSAYAYAVEKCKKEVNAAVQTFNYQVNSMTNTNGQAPFLSVNMYLGETDEYKEELALLIEEFLNQRILGFKNSNGVYITPAFPKLLYVLEEDNIHEDSKYYYLTELAAKCTAKRMVPDYISEKVMKSLKIDENGEGQCYPCMGCLDGEEVITYKHNGVLFVEGFSRMWNRMTMFFEIKHQYNIEDNPNLYMDLENVEIFDTKIGGFTSCYRIIRNVSSKWIDVTISSGRRILCTDDHPFEILNRGVVQAKNLIPGDKVLVNKFQYSENNYNIDPELAWTLGIILCDGCYNGVITVSIAATGEDEIETRYIENMNKFFGVGCQTLLRERGVKGTYKDIVSRKELSNDNAVVTAKKYLNDIFEGEQKVYRHFPSTVFSWNYHSKLAFLAGMIDADGYINNTHRPIIVQLGSTNKELAIQQMLLAQSLGMTARVYHNHYNKNCPEKIRYRIEFEASIDLVQFISCKKKTNNFLCNPIFFVDDNHLNYIDPISEIVSIRPIYNSAFSYDVTTASEHFEVSGIYSHNCRSFLTPYVNKSDGKPKYYGRLNCGVVTISLPDLALSSKGDFDRFWELFEERTELCHRALRIRFDRVANATSDVAPLLWQHGAFARLEPGVGLRDLLMNNYATVSLGYAGLYECVLYMTGESHSHGKGKEFGLQVMQALNNKCNQWKEAENIAYSLYGTPIESTTYKFAKCLRERFGVIKDITDRDYITNSYHLNVREEISAFDKLKIESEYQKLSPGGAISYVECPNMQDNIPAVIELIKFIYDNIMYAELNSKSDYCANCGYDGEIQIKGDQGNLYWECPKCGCKDQDKLYTARRTCGLES